MNPYILVYLCVISGFGAFKELGASTGSAVSSIFRFPQLVGDQLQLSIVIPAVAGDKR